MCNKNQNRKQVFISYYVTSQIHLFVPTVSQYHSQPMSFSYVYIYTVHAVITAHAVVSAHVVVSAHAVITAHAIILAHAVITAHVVVSAHVVISDQAAVVEWNRQTLTAFAGLVCVVPLRNGKPPHMMQ